MAVPVFVDKIFRWHFAQGAEPLRAPWCHPDEIALRDWIPCVAQAVDPAAFEHYESMFHHMYFDLTERRAGLVHHRIHCEVKTHLIGKQAFDLQVGIISQRMRSDGIFIGNDQLWRLRRVDRLVRLLDDGETTHLGRHNSMP